MWFLNTSNTVKIAQNSSRASPGGHSDFFFAVLPVNCLNLDCSDPARECFHHQSNALPPPFLWILENHNLTRNPQLHPESFLYGILASSFFFKPCMTPFLASFPPCGCRSEAAAWFVMKLDFLQHFRAWGTRKNLKNLILLYEWLSTEGSETVKSSKHMQNASGILNVCASISHHYIISLMPTLLFGGGTRNRRPVEISVAWEIATEGMPAEEQDPKQ
ncbi:hypothetical protein B0H10DRAFT_1940633 [Mycena sp. CBHHK59/15]|nr:hypothetical protein B0H10DRAFT_1940633 [Mycena sp. CBHHK59/15]